MQKLVNLPTERGPLERAPYFIKEGQMGDKNSGRTTTANTFCSKRKELSHSNSQISYNKHGGINSCSSNSKKFIFQTKSSKMYPSREDKGISPSFETTDKRSRALGLSRLPNSSYNGTSTGEGSKSTKVKPGTTKTNTSGSEGNAGKGIHFKSLSLKRGIFEQFVSEKSGGNQPVINLKDLNRFIPYKCFKMEGLHCLKYVLQKGDYMRKIDLKDAYFSVFLHKDS